MLLRKLAFLSCAFLTTYASCAAEINVLSAFAVQEALTELVPQFEKATLHRLKITWLTSPSIRKQVSDGASFDLVITAAPDLKKFIADKYVAPGSEVDIGRTGVAVAIKAGAPRPNIDTPEDLRRAILNANGVAHSAGASGQHILKMIESMGIMESVRPTLKEVKPGVRVAALLVSGEASLGFQQMSEFTHEPGITILGYVPAPLQNWTIWSSGIATSSAQTEAARSLQRFLTGAPAVWKAHDIEPARE